MKIFKLDSGVKRVRILLFSRFKGHFDFKDGQIIIKDIPNNTQLTIKTYTKDHGCEGCSNRYQALWKDGILYNLD